MQRLDSMTAKELKKLYYRSLNLRQIGWLSLIGVLLVCLLGYDSESESFFKYTSFDVFSNALSLAGIWVILNVRTKAARIYFYIISILTLIFGALCIGAGILMFDSDMAPSLFIISIFCFFFGIVCFKAAITDCFFEPTFFYHKQICIAYQKRKKDENFKDEDLIISEPNPRISRICIVVAYIQIVLAIVYTASSM